MNDDRPFVHPAGNVEVPAYLVLRGKGYKISAAEQAGGPVWRAENSERRCAADSLVELLGLISMLEARGTDWGATDIEIDAFLHAFPP